MVRRIAVALLLSLGCKEPAQPTPPPAPRPAAAATRTDDCDEKKFARVGGDVKPPVVKHRVPPAYPKTARRIRVDTRIVLDVFVRSDGTVCTVKIVQASWQYVFDEPTVNAVRQWTFEPATRNGKPVDCVFPLTVRFGLQ